MSDGLNFRSAEAHDFEAVRGLAEQLAVHIESSVPPHLPHHNFTVAVDDDDRVIGFMRVDRGEIDSLFISPAFRAQGLGRTFVAQAASSSKALEVDVNTQNLQAVGFYEAMGFRVISSSPLDGDGRPYPLLRMRRQSSAASSQPGS